MAHVFLLIFLKYRWEKNKIYKIITWHIITFNDLLELFNFSLKKLTTDLQIKSSIP